MSRKRIFPRIRRWHVCAIIEGRKQTIARYVTRTAATYDAEDRNRAWKYVPANWPFFVERMPWR